MALLVLGPVVVLSAVVATRRAEERQGGDTTVFDEGPTAFGRALANLDPLRWNQFRADKERFLRQWPERGPWADAVSCAECHYHDGRGPRPDQVDGPTHLVRLAHPSRGGDPVYGIQLRRAGYGVPAPARFEVDWKRSAAAILMVNRTRCGARRSASVELGYGPLDPQTRMSLRVPPAVFGLGLLEAIAERGDPQMGRPEDADGDGVSRNSPAGAGCSDWTVRPRSLRLESVTAVARGAICRGASDGHRRYGSRIHEGWPTNIDAAASHDEPEIACERGEALVRYLRALAVPARTTMDRAGRPSGRSALRRRSGVPPAIDVRCHGRAAGMARAHAARRFVPYTDLLLHDHGSAVGRRGRGGRGLGQRVAYATVVGAGSGIDGQRRRRACCTTDGRGRRRKRFSGTAAKRTARENGSGICRAGSEPHCSSSSTRCRSRRDWRTH